MKRDLTCHCTVCGRAFEYGDHISPMFNDDIWQTLINYYDLTAHEKQALEIQSSTHPLFSEREGHTYICYACAEKALNRPLSPSDLNGSPFNDEFIKFHFQSE